MNIASILSTIEKYSGTIHFLKLNKAVSSPLYNFTSMLLTFFATSILFLPVFTDINLEGLKLLSDIDKWILIYFSLEMAVRLLSGRTRYVRDLLVLDIITIHPLFLELFLRIVLFTPADDMEFPGLLLLKGTRVIRFVYFFQFFYLRRQLGMVTSTISSVIKARFFLGISTFVFILIVLVGMGISYMHFRLTEAQKSMRVERIAGHAKTYGIANTQQIFEDSILNIKQTGPGRNFEIIIKNPEYVKEYYRYNKDFIQIDGITPGSSIQISFKDLNQKQQYLELALLISGIVVISSIVFSLNRYLDSLVLEPVDRAIRVLDLRIKGEEILESGIPQSPFSEITILINKQDKLYQKMRAPKKADLKIPEYKKPQKKLRRQK